MMTQAIDPALLKTPWHFKVKKYTGYVIGFLVSLLPFTPRIYAEEYFEIKGWEQTDRAFGKKRYQNRKSIWFKKTPKNIAGSIHVSIELRHHDYVSVPKESLDAILDEAYAKIKALNIQ